MKYIQLTSSFSGTPCYVNTYEIIALGETLTPIGLMNTVTLRGGSQLSVKETPSEIRELVPDISVFSIKDRLDKQSENSQGDKQ